jgi:hypothetical protein
MKSTGCASSKDSPLRWHRRTHRRKRKKRRKRAIGCAPLERWNPLPPSPRAAEEAVDLVPVAGVEAPATRSSVEVPAGAAEAPAGATVAPPAPSRKRKRDFSNLR